MTSHLVQAYVDKENTTSLGTNTKHRIGSLAGRQAVKAFNVGESSMVTPRRALGNLSNDATRLSGLGNSQKKPLKSTGGSGVFKKPLGSQAKTPGLSMRKPNMAAPSGQAAPKPKMKQQILTASSNVMKPAEIYPDVETMHIYQDKELEFEPLPQDHCLSSYLGRLSSLRVPSIPHTQTRQQGKNTDFSTLQPESNDRLIDNSTPDFSLNSFDVNVPLCLNSCLDLPPLDSVAFMDINNFNLWDEQSTD